MKNKYKEKYGLIWIISITKGSRLILALLGFTTIAISIVNILITIIIKSFVDIAVGDSMKKLQSVVLLSILVVSCLGLLHIVSSLLESIAYNSVEKKLRVSVIGEVLCKPLLEIQKIHTAEIMTRLTVDIASIANLFPKLIGKMFVEVITCILGTVPTDIGQNLQTKGVYPVIKVTSH